MSELAEVATAPVERRAPPTGGAGEVAFRPAPGARRFALAASMAEALGERRFFVLLPFVIIAGLIASCLTPVQAELFALLVVQAILMLALVASLARLTLLRGLALASAFWLGFSLLAVHGALFGTPMLSGSAYGTYAVHVDEVLSESEDGSVRLVISDIRPAAERTRPIDIRRARLFLRGPVAVSAGDTLTAAIRFASVPGPALPGAFDSQFHAYFDGIGAFGTVTSGLTITPDDAIGPGRIVEFVRRAIGERIDAVLPQPSAGIARALITGDQSRITDESRQVLATAGLAHVYSISGLHLTLVAGSVYVAIRFLLALIPFAAVRFDIKKLAALAGIAAALLYFSISGGNVAALRATLMIILVFGAVLAGRRALTMRNVAIAALIIVITDPASVFRPSFQLSFAAVVALIGAYEMVTRRTGKGRGLVRQGVTYFAALAMTSLVAGAATLIFTIYHFQQTSPLGVLGNLAVLPVVSVVMMPSALITALAMPLGLEWLPLRAMGWSIDWMLGVSAAISQWSVGIDASPLVTPASLVFALVALAWFAFFKDRWRLVGPALLAPAVMLAALDREPDVLIADSTQAVAIRTAEGFGLATGWAATFIANVWGETYGDEIRALSRDDLGCDFAACVATSANGLRVAVIRDLSAFAEECSAAALVVTRMPAPPDCRNTSTVIDASDLARGGVHWVAAGPDDALTIRPAIGDPGKPWRPRPRR